MDVVLTENQTMLHDATRRFVQDRSPITQVRKLSDGGAPFPATAWQECAGQGWVGLLVPEDHGGMGDEAEGVIDASIVAEELGRVVFAGPFLPNMVAAYESLSDEMKARLDGLIGVHSFNRMRNPRCNRPGRHKNPEAYFAERSPPDAFHPIVRTHPATGRKALFLGRRPYSYIPGLSLDDSESLLDRLWAHATQDKYAWCHQWQVGDLLLWDNRSAMHRRDPSATT